MSKLKSKFRKPLIVEFILDEIVENESLPDCVTPRHVEPEVTLEEGRRFAFVYNWRHQAFFLFVECTDAEVDREWYSIRQDRYQDFFLMDIYAIVGGDSRVECVSLESCVNMWSVIDIGPLDNKFGQFKFQERLVKSDGTKGQINNVWKKLQYELDDPSSIDPRCKFSYCMANKKYADNTRALLQVANNWNPDYEPRDVVRYKTRSKDPHRFGK